MAPKCATIRWLGGSKGDFIGDYGIQIWELQTVSQPYDMTLSKKHPQETVLCKALRFDLSVFASDLDALVVE